ncbi:MAG: hypothetical protein EBR82_15775 [Caulobacteraceae bacterium]|nr:hypothetical protein [Caulobacteraceae bacterium]
MGKHQMKTILKIATAAAVLVAAGTAMAQDAAPAPATQAAPAGEDWNPFSRSAVKIYMTDVNSFTTAGDITHAKVARVPLDAAAGDHSYAVDEIEMRCAAKQSRTVTTTEYGPDGVQSDRYDTGEDWGPYAAESRDGYLSQIVCDGDRANPPTWPSIKAFIDAGRH